MRNPGTRVLLPPLSNFRCNMCLCSDIVGGYIWVMRIYVHILWRRISPFCTLVDVQVSHMEQWEGAWEETNFLRLISLITTLRPSRYGYIVPDAPYVICNELPVLVTFTTAAALESG